MQGPRCGHQASCRAGGWSGRKAGRVLVVCSSTVNSRLASSRSSRAQVRSSSVLWGRQAGRNVLHQYGWLDCRNCFSNRDGRMGLR
jgi:hypothetical protein